MTQDSIFNITPTDLKKRHYEKEIPEIYQLENYVEENSWHRGSDVLSHTIQVLDNLDKILEFEEFDEALKTHFNTILAKRIGDINRSELLRVAALYHDIGKPTCHIPSADGGTYSPTHAQLGSVLTKNYIQKFDFNLPQIRHIQKIVEYHDFIIDIQNHVIKKAAKKNFFYNLYLQITKEIQPELSLLYLADLRASDLFEEKPKEYENRQKLLFDFFHFLLTKQ